MFVAQEQCGTSRIELRAVKGQCAYVCYSEAESMYNQSLLTLARSVGRGFMPGLERAIDEAGDVWFRPFLLFLPVVRSYSPSN